MLKDEVDAKRLELMYEEGDEEAKIRRYINESNSIQGETRDNKEG